MPLPAGLFACAPARFARDHPASRHFAFVAAARRLRWPASAASVRAAADADTPPLIALIIDDLGNQLRPGQRVVALDGPVACAIMPHTAHATALARAAHAAGKEVILHLPMQPAEMERIAGPGEISLDNSRADLQRILAGNLVSVPHASGVNNHMGSLITRHPGHMRWLMEALAERGDLYFIDSFTTSASVAYLMARETGVPAARRHVFLDNDPSPDAVRRQFEQLKQHALRHGYAIGIGHPYAATLDFLEAAIAALAGRRFPVGQRRDAGRAVVAGAGHRHE